MMKTKKDINGTVREVTPPLKRAQLSDGTPPPDGSTLDSLIVYFKLSGVGYSTSIEAVWTDPRSREGWSAKNETKRYRVVSFQPYHTRPGLRKLLQDAARHVWAISTRQVASTMDGEDPLPGL